MNAFLISTLQHYGYPVLWLVVFIAAVGVPIPGSLLLFAAGAFSAFGEFNILIVFPVALSAAVTGDNVTYFIGRRIGTALLSWVERQRRFRWIKPQSLVHARTSFNHKAGWTIFITRFLLVALGGLINLLAGIEEYPYRRFLCWDIGGQFLGALISLGLGYGLAESWEEVAGLFGAVSALVLVLLICIFLIVLLIRNVRQKGRVEATSVNTPVPVQQQQVERKDKVEEIDSI